jgi:hypothetical protein
MNGWDRFWFTDVSPDIFSVLRILFGLLGCISLFGLLDLQLLWSCQGLIASRASTLCHLFGNLYPRSVLLFSAISFAAMVVGYHTRLAVASSFASVFLIAHWNNLPLSAAHQVLRSMLFCLIWADCGRTYSVDAWLARGKRRTVDVEHRAPIWPLRLLQIQVAAIYLITGLWKLNNVLWRDGTALHYVLQNPQFRRFAVFASPALDPWTIWATYVALAWELSFAFLVFHRRTRRAILAIGVVMHLGLWAGLELGPFSWLMLASYIAFLDPNDVTKALRGVTTRIEEEKIAASG